MIAITTNSSISVKPFKARRCDTVHLLRGSRRRLKRNAKANGGHSTAQNDQARKVFPGARQFHRLETAAKLSRPATPPRQRLPNMLSPSGESRQNKSSSLGPVAPDWEISPLVRGSTARRRGSAPTPISARAWL